VRHSTQLLPTIAIGALLAACSSSGDGTWPNDSGTVSPSGEDSGAPPGMTTPPAFDAGAPFTPDSSSFVTADAGSGSSADGAASADGGAGDDAAPPTTIDGYTLVWSDEFNGADGTAVDPSKWVHETGGNNANQELEYCSDSIDNSQQRGGNLVITATSDGQGNYTSARINTSGNFSQQYGRIEARAQLPYGQGLWPAFWMLGDNIGDIGWPACGEIDIMETIGTDVGENHGSLHSPGWDPSAVSSPADGAQLSDGFHTYAIEWDPGEIRFYLDDNLYETRDASDAPDGAWVFDNQPFFIIINVAVGGNFPGNPDGTTVFPQKLLVDWVRVYKKSGQ
jgi:beta-glucanase (GH16 family)